MTSWNTNDLRVISTLQRAVTQHIVRVIQGSTEQKAAEHTG